MLFKEVVLTIIIPHYNSPHLLNRLLSTIPDNQCIQTIVIDDRSNKYLDELVKVINESSKKIEYFTNDRKNRGAGTCRNIGLENAKGKWILFADADDYFVSDFYVKVEKFFASNYDIIFFSPISEYNDTGETADRHELYAQYVRNYMEYPSRQHLLELKSSVGNPPWSKLVSHSLIRQHKILFDETLHANDIMFSSKLGVYSNKIYATQDVIYCVTKNKGSLTTYADVDSFDIRLNEYIKVCNFLRKHYDKHDREYLHIAGIGFLLTAIEQKYGLRKVISVFRKLCDNDIPIIRRQSYSVTYLMKQLEERRKQVRRNQVYINNEK